MSTKQFEKIMGVPATLFHKGSLVLRWGMHRVSRTPVAHESRKYLKNLGPGLITGAADDDPSGIATYSQAGAQYGYGFLWLSLFSFPFMSVVQEICGRMALVTGRGLAGTIRQHYSKSALGICVTLLFVTNVFNIGVDLGAMALAGQMLFPAASTAFLLIAIAFVGLVLEIYLSYKTYAKYLKWITITLFAYVVSMFVVHLPAKEIISHTLIPSFHFDKKSIFLLTALLGTTISPYLFFWQTSQEVEEEILEGKTSVASRVGTTKQEISRMRTDVFSGMFFSNLVMFSIIAVCGATLYAHGVTNITSATDAALALKPLAGNFAFALFALGIIGTGILAVPVLAGSASYAIAETFGWKEGLYRKLKEARAFYGVIIVAVVVGLLINFLHIDPIKALLYSAVGNGLIAPVILFFIMRLSDNKGIMGEHKNHWGVSAIGWTITVIMALAGIATIVSFFV